MRARTPSRDCILLCNAGTQRLCLWTYTNTLLKHSQEVLGCAKTTWVRLTCSDLGAVIAALLRLLFYSNANDCVLTAGICRWWTGRRRCKDRTAAVRGARRRKAKGCASQAARAAVADAPAQRSDEVVCARPAPVVRGAVASQRAACACAPHTAGRRHGTRGPARTEGGEGCALGDAVNAEGHLVLAALVDLHRSHRSRRQFRARNIPPVSRPGSRAGARAGRTGLPRRPKIRARAGSTQARRAARGTQRTSISGLAVSIGVCENAWEV